MRTVWIFIDHLNLNVVMMQMEVLNIYYQHFGQDKKEIVRDQKTTSDTFMLFAIRTR
jgi:hypothetical protein